MCFGQMFTKIRMVFAFFALLIFLRVSFEGVLPKLGLFSFLFAQEKHLPLPYKAVAKQILVPQSWQQKVMFL